MTRGVDIGATGAVPTAAWGVVGGMTAVAPGIEPVTGEAGAAATTGAFTSGTALAVAAAR